MLRLEWNALRPGDHVLVHDPRTAEMTLTDGVVTSVDTHKGLNGVGIRVGAGHGETWVLWPSSFIVHRAPRDPTEPCWRCQEFAERAAPSVRTPSGTPAAGADKAARLAPHLRLSDLTATPT